MQLKHTAKTWMYEFIPAALRPRAASTVAVPAAAPPVSSLKVLLVDDCEVNRMLARAQLLHLGIEPTLACDGVQAVELVASQVFDIVLMDVSMPVMDGVEATDRIRRLERDHPERTRVPVVAYTAGAVADDPALLKRHGFDDLLRKPCSTRLIGACLEQVCGVSVQ